MAEKQSQIWVYESTRAKIKHIQRLESASKNDDLSIADVVEELAEQRLKSIEIDENTQTENA